jgi:hypothetical protein
MIGQIVGGLTGIAGGIIGSGARKREQRRAQQEFNTRKDQYENLDTSNVYQNMENTMEDLTVNQQAADFQAQQQQQGLANTMASMSGAAGGSGIAALAQAMANQQSQNLQSASADIGRQESQNQMAAAQEAGRLQLYEAKGELISRDAEQEKTETLLGMSQQDLTAANKARQAATNSILGGVGGLASVAAQGIFGEGTFMENIGLGPKGKK